jgi:hypothetical protein
MDRSAASREDDGYGGAGEEEPKTEPKTEARTKSAH